MEFIHASTHEAVTYCQEHLALEGKVTPPGSNKSN